MYSEKLVNILIEHIIEEGYCPDDFDLEIKEFEINCNPEADCAECWREALKE